MFFRNLTAVQKGLVLVLVPVFFELGLLAVLGKTLLKSEDVLNQIDYSRRAVLQLQGFQAKMAEALTIGFDIREGQSNQIAAVNKLIEMEQSQGKLGDLNIDANPELRSVAKEIDRLNTKSLALCRQWRDVLVNGQPSPTERSAFMPTALLYVRVAELEKICKKITAIENQTKAAEPKQLEEVRNNILRAIAGGTAVSIIISFALAMLFTSDILARLKRISATALKMGDRRGLPSPAPGRDEIAQLERSLYEASLALADLRRKESAMLDNAVDIICSLDENLYFTGINAAASKLWLYPQAKLRKMSLFDLLDPSRHNQTQAAFEHIADGSGAGSVENQLRGGDGLVKNFLWKVRWSAQEKRFFCVVHDVSALRAVEKLRQQFISMVCHDLRNPIMSVGVGIELITAREEGSMSPNIRSQLAKLKQGSDNLAALTTEFLALEKLESGMSITNERMVSLLDACLLAQESLAILAEEMAIEIDLPSHEGLVWADEERLVQAVTSFLSYAIKASPPGSKVQMKTSNKDGMVELLVVDKAPVLEAEERSLLFERFRIGAGSRHAPEKFGRASAGFGLAAARAIVEALGGKVGFALSQSGNNSLWMRLPTHEPEGGDDP